jgi:hypothetical protein
LASRTCVVDTVAYYPIIVTEQVTIKRLLWRTGSTGGNGTYDVGLYDSDADGEPSTQLVALGAASFPAANTEVASDITDTVLPPGLYYVAFVSSSASDSIMGWQVGPGTQTATDAELGVFYESSATLPSSATPTQGISGTPPLPRIVLTRH